MLLCLNVILTAVPHLALAGSEEPENEQAAELIISSVDDFLEFAENCRLDSFSSNLNVILKIDIDLTDIEFYGVPIFCGTFDGQGHSVAGLSISKHGSAQGLFRYVMASAVIQNLNVHGRITPEGSHSCVGGIAGINSGTINNCTFTGRVTGAECIGGIAGRNDVTGIIENCSVQGNLYADHFIGGIAGENTGVIRFCKNSADINTVIEHNTVELSDITLDSLTGAESAVVATDIGGIAGTSIGLIRDCENNGSIGYQHVGYNIGGIAGSQAGFISHCVNNGQVNGRKEVGGIVGQMEPSTVINYQPDTMQILEGQLNTLSGMLDSTASNAQGTASELASQMTSMEAHLNNARESIQQLIAGPDGGVPDEDSTTAALNSLSSSISSMNGIMNGMAATGEESISTLNNDIDALVGQVGAIGQTIADSESLLGGAIIDASDADTEDDTSGKVADCKNHGQILADLNAGGIVGAMSLENDLDPESDIQILGNSSMNYDCEVRAVVLRCENHGAVSARRQNVGGIVGWMSLGLIRDSVNLGSIDALNAKYVGGIAGQGNGFIRECSVKCVISGSSYVGGIAGTAGIVTACRAMVELDGCTEKSGAILGYTDKLVPESEEDEPPVAGNYYLPVSIDFGGIDGISYSAAAEALGDTEFFGLPDLPGFFRVVTVTFIFEDGTQARSTIGRGKALNVTDIPLVPEKEGYIGCWDGFDDFDIYNVMYDRSFALKYTPLSTTVQSDEVRSNGLPVFLAEGVLDREFSLKLEPSGVMPELGEKETLIELWNIESGRCSDGLRLRYQVPEDCLDENIELIVLGADDKWERRTYESDGRYIVFPADGSEKAIGLVNVPENHIIQIAAIGSSVLLLAAVCAVFFVRRSLKKKSIE